MEPPKLIFIVPYRDRDQHYKFFKTHMNTILENIDHRILYIHQNDKRSFNRGALKNIGFMIVKDIYPNNYQNITLVFNDIDTMPFTPGFLNYETTKSTIKHFYGFKYALGGIVSIKASDFEKVNGFPNYWGWGFEDNELQKRVLKNNMKINRSQFYDIMDKNIIQFQHGFERPINRGDMQKYKSNSNEGINSIKNLQYINKDDFIDINSFDTGRIEDSTKRMSYDLKKGNKINLKRIGALKMCF
jgi:hypothetical protein